MKPRTPEHQARVDRIRARLAAMPDHKVISVLEAIMGFGDDEIDSMGEEEVDAMLRAEGIDPKTSHLSVMGQVLAGLSRTLHDYRTKMAEIHELAYYADETDSGAMIETLADIVDLSVVPSADED